MIQTTENDILLIGHGSTGDPSETINLPANVELWVMQPIGFTLTDKTMQALVQMEPIEKLCTSETSSSGKRMVADAYNFVSVYKGRAPNLTLSPLEEQQEMVDGFIDDCNAQNKPFYLTTAEDQGLSLNDLLYAPEYENVTQINNQNASRVRLRQKLDELSENGPPLRIFWAACSSHLSDDSSHSVYPNAQACLMYCSIRTYDTFREADERVQEANERANLAIDELMEEPDNMEKALQSALSATWARLVSDRHDISDHDREPAYEAINALATVATDTPLNTQAAINALDSTENNIPRLQDIDPVIVETN